MPIGSFASGPGRWAPTPSEPGPGGERERLLADETLTGRALCAALSDHADRWLTGLLDNATGGANGVALVAVGGYGRQELCPGSDLDVLLLHRGKGSVAEIADRVWYPIWDEGVKLGHAVRTVKEAVGLAADDLDTATSLLDARHLAGDRALSDDLVERAAANWQRKARHWLGQLGRAVDDRHDRSGEVAFLLEPDLKEGRGGLRDVHSLRWAEAARRVLFPGDDDALRAAYDVLLQARVELHRRTGKPLDRLLLQEQDAVAEVLGDPDADALMARVSAAARTIAWTSDDAWDRVRSSIGGPIGRLARRDQPAGPGLVLRDGQVHVDVDASPGEDPVLLVRAAAVAARYRTRIDRSSLDLLAEEAPVLPDPWPGEARPLLVDLLLAGNAALPVLEALDQRGLLVRVLPEWEPVRSRPQRNAYHRFTVDRHLCEAAAEAATRADRVARPDLLVVGAWLHDLGKGYPGDHTDVGMSLMRGVATRMGFSPGDVDVLVELVRLHLLLPDVATRRDLSDERTISRVVDEVGSLGTLELLAVLTEADSVATGPAAWGPWKAGLVNDLVARVREALGGERAAQAVAAFPSPEHELLMARRELVVRGDGDTLTVVAPDRPGLFCRVAGALALGGLDVLSADIYSNDAGMALEVFRAAPSFGDQTDWSRVEADVRRALSGRPLAIDARLRERADTYRSRQPAAPAPVVPHVVVDNDSSGASTVVEVRAPDGVGVLYRITRALADLDLDIHHAKVQTLGHEVVDSFYVRDAKGAKLVDPEDREEVERAILAALNEN